MNFYDQFLKVLRQAAYERFGNPSQLAEFLGVAPAVLHRWLNGQRQANGAKMGDVMDALGVHLVLPDSDADQSRQVQFVNAKVVNKPEEAPPLVPDDYLAVPLIAEAGAGPGIVPCDDQESWFLVYQNEPSIRLRSNLIAVRIAKGSTSMEPTLAPGDIVLVDRNDRNVSRPGNIWLVMEPDGSGKVKRLKVDYDRDHNETQLTYYSDNVAQNPPEVYSLERHFDGDLNKAVVGRVIWGWSDLTNK